ncbi:phosphoadenylyl-sulfate reductase [Pedobacter duraquae]|uniref:Adenosine 5'-phosphosulfate reductase n=1 Tax=Pedobacter duraquae TaxID=425511 RepID=A0A4R6IK57_9SPHI|nr:phosphoadenylyl-sulfate reductase [Pedobacter duraquae]TDO22335.1 phosphoadenosine phosphosulfate reductase [Pedobacter duraquae]
MNENLTKIAAEIGAMDPVAALRYLSGRFAGKITFSTSFGLEDQVITDFIFANHLPIPIFTLETGRLFPETYYVWNRTLERYQQPIAAYFPNADKLGAMVNTKGPSSFYASVENRKECCQIRKIEPLKRALNGMQCWITGIRADQSLNRNEMTNLEWDEGNQLIKFHPLFNWTLEDVKAYVKTENLVYNPLHDKGFPSVGCAPCTRAVKEGEDFRAGRWWWEDQSKKECGLHTTNEK